MQPVKSTPRRRTAITVDANTIKPYNGYYTATQAMILLHKNRVSFASLVKEYKLEAEKNTSDRRSRLYRADEIDRLRARAVPTH